MQLEQFERALEAFERANSISRHDATYLHMGEVRSSYPEYYRQEPNIRV